MVLQRRELAERLVSDETHQPKQARVRQPKTGCVHAQGKITYEGLEGRGGKRETLQFPGAERGGDEDPSSYRNAPRRLFPRRADDNRRKLPKL